MGTASNTNPAATLAGASAPGSHWRQVLQTLRRHVLFLIFLLVLAVGVYGAYVWLDNPHLGPYLVGFVTGFGALCAALPALLQETPAFKWTAAVIGGVCVGLGTWYSATDLDERLRTQTKLKDALTTALTAISPAERSPVIVQLGTQLQHMFDERDYATLSELANLVNIFSPENGHALYYKGEFWRISKNLENMRGFFKRYFAQANVESESKTGSRPDCYKRVSGYCAERTAYIAHMMANDAYREALTMNDTQDRIEWLNRSLDFSKIALNLRKGQRQCGFEKTESLKATNDIRKLSVAELNRLQVKDVKFDVPGCPL